MAKESFYDGSYPSFDANYGNYVGFRIPGGQLSQSINPSTANQLAETSKALKTGLKNIEVQMLGVGQGSPDQTIPKQHFKEIRALMKLSGAQASLHGPLTEASGFDGRERFDEMARIKAEKRYIDAMEKGYELNPKGNTTVVFHAATSTPGPIFTPNLDAKPGTEERWNLHTDFAVDQKTGQTRPIQELKQYDVRDPELLANPDPSKRQTVDEPKRQIQARNSSSWRDTMTELAQFDKTANELMGGAGLRLKDYENAARTQDGFFDLRTRTPLPNMTPEQESDYEKMRSADIFLDNIQLQFSNAFDTAFEFGTPEQQKKLVKLSEQFTKEMTPNNVPAEAQVWQPVIRREALRHAIDELRDITYGQAPQQFVHAHEFFKEKTSDTFADTAFDSYKKFKKHMPTIAIENYKEGVAFNRAEDLKELIEISREKFAKLLVEKGKVNKKQAKKIAEERIGATWDVGHVHLHKQYGFTDEDFVGETKKIASVMKHLHLTDNFGYEDSHLVPGMGNVPIKEHLEELEKQGVLKKVQKVVEAGGYIQQLAQHGVHGETMAAFGSPIYGARMQTFWNDPQFFSGNYFGGYGNLNPTNHHNMYGAGFSNLPAELGGQIPGGGSRFSGNSLA